MKSEIVYKVNKPEWFRRTDFMEFVNASGTATWHHKGRGKPNEYSDVFVWASTQGVDDPDCCLPEDIESELVVIAEQHGDCLVWIQNLA